MFAVMRARLEGALRIAENVCAAIAGCAALVAMLTVSADAVLRHVFARPLTFQLHLTEHYLLVALLLLALPWGYRTGGFVRIAFLVEAAPARLAGALQRTGLIAAAGYVGYLAYRGAEAFWSAYQSGEVEMGVIDWPVAWSLVFVPVGMTLLALRLLVDASAPRPFGNAEAAYVD